jgi:hypothetical protein
LQTETTQRCVHPNAQFVTFEVAESAAALRSFTPLLYVGEKVEVLKAFDYDSQTGAIFGMSPFSAMTMDLSGVVGQVPANYLESMSLVLLMTLDFKVEADDMTWIPEVCD